MRVIDLVRANAERTPEKVALICGEQSLSYAKLMTMANGLAAGLAAQGIGPGSRLGLALPNCVEFVVTLLAASARDMTVIPASPTLPVNALLKLFRTGKADALVVWHAIEEKSLKVLSSELGLPVSRCITAGSYFKDWLHIDELMTVTSGPEALPDSDGDASYILTMTSGSTGDPKPIVLTQKTKILRSRQAQELYGVTDRDVVLAATPLYHSLAERLVILPLITGGTSVLMKGFSPRMWIDHVAKHRVTFSIAVSSQLQNILQEISRSSEDLSSLRCIVSSSALLKAHVKSQLLKTMACDFHECYGTSEIAIASNLSTENTKGKMDTVGRACPGVSIRILDDQQRDVDVGEVGEIACRTPLAFAGYFNNIAASMACMHEEHFLTGDLGFLDGDGFLHFAGRKKEVIITGGINVYPKDIEDEIGSHPSVQECAVIGVEDEALGEAVLAVVELRSGMTLDERALRRHCVGKLADYQQPAGYVIVSELPRNPMGKVQKKALIEEYKDIDLRSAIRSILRR